MKMHPVTSSQIAEVGYDGETGTLHVLFNNGGLYEYDGVPPDIFEGLRDSLSPGRYLHQHIRDAFSYRRI